MADALTINLAGGIQTKVNGSITDIVDILDRDVAGTLKFETTLTLTAGAANLQVATPTSIIGVGKYLCVRSDLDITVSLNSTSNLIQTRQLLVKLGTPFFASIYLSNANATDATVRIYIAG